MATALRRDIVRWKNGLKILLDHRYPEIKPRKLDFSKDNKLSPPVTREIIAHAKCRLEKSLPLSLVQAAIVYGEIRGSLYCAGILTTDELGSVENHE